MFTDNIITEMEIKDLREFILATLTEYSLYYSCSGKEGPFYKAVKEKFLSVNRSFSVREVYKENSLFYSLFTGSRVFPYIFVVHLDRVGKYNNTIVDKGNLLQGQLDNIISIAVLTYLAKHLNFNILFTTVEETCTSWPQLQEVSILFPKAKLITIDIDVFTDEKDLADGKISLRESDGAGIFSDVLVKLLRNVADTFNTPYYTTEGWSYVETSMLQQHTGLTGAHIGIPLLNYHTPREITSWLTVINCIKFLFNFISHHEKKGILHESHG